MQDQSFKIVSFTPELAALYRQMVKDFGFDVLYYEHYERCLERYAAKELEIVFAVVGEKVIGFCILNWEPKYSYFKKSGIPEIQDLNVLREFRQRGIGQALIEFCENIARLGGCQDLGIGVGLDRSFGAAQRLYVRLGYIPDGSGVNYDRQQVAPGEFRPIDENLSLMMTKSLKI